MYVARVFKPAIILHAFVVNIAFSSQSYGLALFAGNVVIASDEGAKQSPKNITKH